MPEYEEPLPGVLLRRLKRFTDDRGWLVELFRDDELPVAFGPTMGYISVTHAGVARGPHEHTDQTDGFVFLSGTFRLYLWENRSGNEPRKLTFDLGEGDPAFVTVPPGVVHAYKNIGDGDAFVLNFPDRLYAGKGKAEPVDEIRHEDDNESKFRMDD
jgi:dTDP-4-dehydrorhamnose 3,5-epimerase